MTEYVIGIDIGATKSHLALFDSDGNLIDFGRWGCLNYEVMPGLYSQFENEFGQFVSQVLSKNGMTMKQIAYSVLGVGGIDTRTQHGIISRILEKQGFERFTLANDSFLGIPAGTPKGIGICAINGSGCVLGGINKEGAMMQIGGVGSITADYGGGGYIGARVVSAVYSELFRRGEPTCLTSILFEKLGITSKYDYVETIHKKIFEEGFKISSCTRMVFEAVKHDDRVAIAMLNDIAVNYANGISCMIEELHFPPGDELNIVFAGSVFVKGEHPLLLDMLKKMINDNHPDYRFHFNLLDVPNVAGAVIWALNILNDKNCYSGKIRDQLREML